MQYVKNQLQGTVVTGQNLPMISYVTPPVMDNVGGAPKAYVWAGTADGSRQTMPRGAGFRKIAWPIDIYLQYETNPNRPTVNGVGIDNQFPLIVDAILTTLWSVTPMPTFIDGNGNVIGTTYVPSVGATQLHFVAENWRLVYPTERTPNTLRMLWYSAQLTVDVVEVIQG